MPNVAHSTLTGADLHEPKGVATAAVNRVYAADGAGSGAWVDPNSLVTSTNFTTGDVKLTFKTTADSGWVLMNDGSIGSATSGASTRANADTESLFTLLWNNVSNTYAPVSSGRGATAAGDWAANKNITLPAALGRALACYGAGSGLGALKVMGQTEGAYTVQLTEANMPTHTHTFSGTTSAGGAHNHSVNILSDAGSAHSHTVSDNTANEATHTHGINLRFGGAQAGSDMNAYIRTGGTAETIFTNAGVSHAHVLLFTTDTESAHTHAVVGTTGNESSHTHTFSGTTSSTGGSTAHNNTQPTLYLNVMVKL